MRSGRFFFLFFSSSRWLLFMRVKLEQIEMNFQRYLHTKIWFPRLYHLVCDVILFEIECQQILRITFEEAAHRISSKYLCNNNNNNASYYKFLWGDGVGSKNWWVSFSIIRCVVSAKYYVRLKKILRLIWLNINFL